jgi:hypothetical protein
MMKRGVVEVAQVAAEPDQRGVVRGRRGRHGVEWGTARALEPARSSRP